LLAPLSHLCLLCLLSLLLLLLRLLGLLSLLLLLFGLLLLHLGFTLINQRGLILGAALSLPAAAGLALLRRRLLLALRAARAATPALAIHRITSCAS